MSNSTPSNYTPPHVPNPDEVTPREWRWVILVSGALVILTLIPYLIAFGSNKPTDDWRFMGLLYNVQDGVSYLSKIGEGLRGSWVYSLQFTSEAHGGVPMWLYYLGLGHLARIFNLSPLVIYYIARLLAMLMMLLSFYHLGSVIWQRRRPRRLFFIILAVGSGLGWLYLLLFGYKEPLPVDINLYESVPFFASITTAHFALVLGLLALLASVFIRIFRPGFDRAPSLLEGGAGVMIISLLLAILLPLALVTFALALAVYLLIDWITNRHIPWYKVGWASMAILPAMPLIVYYQAITYYDPVFSVWNSQNYIPSPPFLSYVIGLGIPLLIALPGMWRAIRHWELDGDRFMLLWFAFCITLVFLPFNFQSRFIIGISIPVAFFAVRAIEDFWMPRLTWPQRKITFVLLMLAIVPSNVLALLWHLPAAMQGEVGLRAGLALPRDMAVALNWLDQPRFDNKIAVASQPMFANAWIPAFTPMRVVWGHPIETLNPNAKVAAIEDWYAGNHCTEFIQKYGVNILIMDMGSPSSACVAQLGLSQPVQQFGNIAIYEVNP